MKVRTLFLTIVALSAIIQPIKLEAQSELPTCDLYMVTMINNGQRIKLSEPIYLSGFHPNGYNNQPAFLSPNELYVTTNLYDAQFTDIVRLDLKEEKYYRVTATDSISEYSPTPSAPDNSWSCVRVEKDGITQSLHLYPDNHMGYGKRVLSDQSSIGYHTWLSDDVAGLFIVGTQMKLAIANIRDNNLKYVIDDIGRCLKKDGDGNLLFVHKTTPSTWYIKRYNVSTGSITPVLPTRPGSEDFELLSDGTLITAENGKLYTAQLDNPISWTEIADLTSYEIQNITRIVSSRNRLVFVNSVE